MGIHVIGSVLGVVFDNEEGGLGPEFREAHGFDKPAQGQVVVGHQGRRGELAGGGPLGVVVWQPQDLESRHIAFRLEAFEARR